MESVRIERTQKAPLFVLKDGYVRLSGRSIPQNARLLYKICFDWIEQYVQLPSRETKIDLFFEYIDTSSIRCVVDMLAILSHIPEKNPHKRVEINWYYEKDDEDSNDLGVYIQAHLKVPFNIIPIEEGSDIPTPIP